MQRRRIRFFRARKLWVPAWPLVVCVFVVMAVLARWTVLNVHPYLALNRPADPSTILVVEGWLPDIALESVARDFFSNGHYARVYTTGGDLSYGSYLSEHQSYAQLAARTFQQLGIDESRIIAAPAGPGARHRTWRSAIALRVRLENDHPGLEGISGLNVVTEGIHSRRTFMIYRKVFDDTTIDIGVISLPPDTYDPDEWWSSSDGVKTLVTEFLATAYEILADSGR